MWQLGDKMKRILALILLIFFGCSTQSQKSVDIPNFNSSKAFTYLVKQCEFGPRNPGSSGHLEFSNYLEGFLNQLDGNVIIQEFIYTEPITSMERNGKNLIIGIDIVFFDAEDGGFSGQPETFALGSKYFAENLPIAKPNFAIIVDMVGDKNLTIPIERISYNIAPKKVKEIWNLAEELSLPAFKKKIAQEIYDDHVPLWEIAEIPAIDIIDFQYPNMFYNHWHTQNDTPENCSPQSLGQVGNLLVNYIYGSVHK